MPDIRKACKIFLDFIYDNNILPNEISDTMKKSCAYGDIRMVCNIVRWNSNYRNININRNRNTDEQIPDITNMVDKFNNLDEKRKDWLKSSFVCQNLNSIKTICNNFFHNVYECNSDYILFASTCSSIIERADFIDKETQNQYIKEINDALMVPPQKNYIIELNKPCVIENKKNKVAPQSSSSKKGIISDVVKTDFRQILQSDKISEHEITQLMNMDYCKQFFKTKGRQFPILVTERNNPRRYYAEPIKIRDKIYYISSQWYNDQLPYLKKWIKEHNCSA